MLLNFLTPHTTLILMEHKPSHKIFGISVIPIPIIVLDREELGNTIVQDGAQALSRRLIFMTCHLMRGAALISIIAFIQDIRMSVIPISPIVCQAKPAQIATMVITQFITWIPIL